MRRCLIVFAVGCNFSAGNANDATTGSEPAPPIDANIVFVTSNTVVIGALGGLEKADAFCQMSATAAQLPGTYVAWLSTMTTNAASRLANARGWVRRDGKPVVDAVDDLVAGRILYPPRLDENGVDDAMGAFVVATATAGNGMRDGETCGDYRSTSGAITVGRADGAAERWTNAKAGVGCTSAVHLYCFGVDRSTMVMATPAPGRRAFVSTGPLTLAGIVTADQQCASEAMTAGLPGTFVAALATTTESASSHVGVGPWVRVDGVAIGKLDAQLAPLDVTADGAYVATQVWTGASAPDQVGTSASTCADWASTSGSGLIGDSARSSGVAFDDGAVPCTTALGVFCLQM